MHANLPIYVRILDGVRRSNGSFNRHEVIATEMTSGQIKHDPTRYGDKVQISQYFIQLLRSHKAIEPS